MVRFGNEEDIDAWMALVKTVRWSFPGLETERALSEHRQTVLRFMKEQRALCVKEDGRVAGVLLFSKKRNMICCLAVHPEERGKGIATQLLAEALSQLDRTRNIEVTTFRREDEKGVAPRALYQKFGFVEGELLEEFGYPSQRLILYPPKHTSKS